MRFLQFNWKNDSALMKSSYVYEGKPINSSMCGYFVVEFSINTRHECILKYGYEKDTYITNGYSQLIYNKNILLKTEYKSKEEFQSRKKKKHVNVIVENFLKPIGISYMHHDEFRSNDYLLTYPINEFKKVGDITFFSNNI